MSQGSGIEWTDATWNPVVGCTRASAGCDNCYAVTMTHRLETMGQEKYAGLTVLNGRGDRHFNGTVRTVPEALEIPLGWRKPRRVFVNSMSDLFHRDVPFEFVDRVFAVMALCPQHVFQVLTKRPERMAEYLSRCAERGAEQWYDAVPGDAWARRESRESVNWERWPLPNVWLGTSCEDQAAADARIPHLLRCPAAVRFLSCEPLLGGLDLSWWLGTGDYAGYPEGGTQDAPRIHWVIVGGESGRGARPTHVKWHLSLRDQCRDAGVAFFEKQLGARFWVDFYEQDDALREWALSHRHTIYQPSVLKMVKWSERIHGQPNSGAVIEPRLNGRKGGEPAEWPEDLRVREMPEVTT